jgi:acylphosphatase
MVRGRVQGVYFRRFVATHAAELGLGGFARNLPDGAVEVVAEGDAPQLQRLVDLLHSGPPAARVTGVSVSWSDHTGAYDRFSAR